MATAKIRLIAEKTFVHMSKVYVKGDPLTTDKKTAEKYVQRKLAKIADSVTRDEFDDMDVTELIEYAQEAGVDIGGASEESEIISMLREATK